MSDKQERRSNKRIDCYNRSILNSEIEHSIVLEHSKVLKPGIRVQDSLIGRNAKLTGDTRKPRALKMNLGDHSTFWIPGNG